MSTVDIVRAWKDATYRSSLSVEEQALLPEHPAGSIELADEDLPQVAGGIVMSAAPVTAGCCVTNAFTTPCCPTAAFTATCCPNFI